MTERLAPKVFAAFLEKIGAFHNIPNEVKSKDIGKFVLDNLEQFDLALNDAEYSRDNEIDGDIKRIVTEASNLDVIEATLACGRKLNSAFVADIMIEATSPEAIKDTASNAIAFFELGISHKQISQIAINCTGEQDVAETLEKARSKLSPLGNALRSTESELAQAHREVEKLELAKLRAENSLDTATGWIVRGTIKPEIQAPPEATAATQNPDEKTPERS